jgi:endogenous inhibitor of DNA gyrase (YacG/DUF329 family)
LPLVVSCPSCHKKYRLEEKHFAGRERFQFSCPGCGKPIQATLEQEARPLSKEPPAQATQKLKRMDATWTDADVPEAELLGLPQGKRVSVAVLQGADSGIIFSVEKPLVVIGRAEADLVLNDSEVSRHHARLEFKGISVILRDLKSTNGTYVNEQRVTATAVSHQTEFRVGASTLMLILTDEID